MGLGRGTWRAPRDCARAAGSFRRAPHARLAVAQECRIAPQRAASGRPRNLDNLTHTLLGAALARTRLARLSPRAGLWLVLGANLPDLDVAAALAGKAAYLEHHRGVTHALPGIAAQALLLAALASWIDGRAAGEGAGPPARRFGRLALLGGAALATHPLLDLLNVYGLRPWLPFASGWIYGDMIFILDPWMWLVLAAAAWLGGPPRKGLDRLVGAVLALGLAIVLLAPGAPPFLRAAWPLAAATLVALRRKGFGRARPRAVLACAGALLGAYVAAHAVLGAAALRRGLPLVERAMPSRERVVEVAHAPLPADPLAWQVLVETEQAVYVQGLHLARGPGPLSRHERRADDPAVRAVLAAPCGLRWSGFARFPFARTGPADAQGARWVQLLDARYVRTPLAAELGADEGPPEGAWFSLEARTGPQGVACDPDGGSP